MTNLFVDCIPAPHRLEIGAFVRRSACDNFAALFTKLFVNIVAAATAVARGYGAMAARLTPDQKVGSSNLSALTFAVW